MGVFVPPDALPFGSNRFDQERFLTVVASFALGYLAAILFDSHINAQFGTLSGPSQITKPPQGDKHPRGFRVSPGNNMPMGDGPGPSSHSTLRWRKADSNSRSHLNEKPFRGR